MDTLDAIEQQNKPVPFAGKSIQWGIIAGLGNLILSMVLYLLGLQFEWVLSLLGYVIIFACIIACVRSVREAHPFKFITFGKAFKAAFVCSFIAMVIMLVFFNIYVEYIDTSYFEQFAIIQKEKMLKQGLSEEEVAAAMKMQEKFTTPTMRMVFASISNLVMSVILSLIAAAILKRNPK